MDFKTHITKQLASCTDLKTSEIDALLEIPPSQEMGDFAFPCFSLAKSMKKAPNMIAQELAQKIGSDNIIKEVRSVGPYLNFFVNKEMMAEKVLKVIFKDKDYGKCKPNKKVVLVESPGPNTNKPLHLGHLRNLILGHSILHIFGFNGYETHLVDVVNDRGVHICKSMLAYKKWNKKKEPDKKSDHFVGDMYVLYSKHQTEETEKEIRVMLKKWEEGDPETIALWKKMRKWCLDGFKETYKKFKFLHEKQYFESNTYKGGKEIVQEGLKTGIFEKDDDGSVFIDLNKFKLDKKILQRSDGTAVYMTQDLFMASERYKDYKMDKMTYVVGSEQIYHFNVLFKVFELLKRPFTKGCHHLAYGMVNLPEGKMKSREGTVVDTDDLLDEMIGLAKVEIKKRSPKISAKEMDDRAYKIAMGALRFFILKMDPYKDMVYDPKESISFEGETGPYVQYAYARICSIFRKYGEKVDDKVDYGLLKTNEEAKIIKLLEDYPLKVKEAAEHYKPSLIARYLLDLAQAFNEYYHSQRILQAESEELVKARLFLIDCIKQVLKSGLALLVIEAPEEM